MSDDAASRGGSALTEGLGPLPEPGKVLREPPAFYKDEWREHHFYTADQMRAYAAEQVAAERERLKADAESWGNALNQAGWAATEAYRRHTGQVEPAIFFNHAKGILRDALAVYFKALRA